MKSGIILGLLALVSLLVACQNEQELAFNRYYSAGAVVYQTHCQNCHGAKGEGLNMLIPPLNDSTFLKQHRNQLACYLQNGLKDTIDINGRKFEDVMPAADITPMEMAQVLTYVNNSFGNKLGLVDIEMVNKDLGDCGKPVSH